ncbi:2Fe-2S iron-sulfur cluster-binding protein [Deinococcus radiophilus]|uniref:2Fe-2S iron-sulfur cluster-binding protein n=1 Tax=Deinococcus radiophilus TaxID=32062 RepID=UPI00361BC344
MSTITVNAEGFGQIEVPQGERLVLALERLGTGILHRCGGQARCTTCQVEFTLGEPQQMTQAERGKLEEKGLLGQVRLSCQIECQADMTVRSCKLRPALDWKQARRLPLASNPSRSGSSSRSTTSRPPTQGISPRRSTELDVGCIVQPPSNARIKLHVPLSVCQVLIIGGIHINLLVFAVQEVHGVTPICQLTLGVQHRF